MCAVCPSTPTPRTITWPRAQADDIGARLKVPSSFSVESSTTGVPKYRMLGVMVRWSADVARGTLLGVAVFMGSTVGRGHFDVRRSVAGG
ncbi:hypothetical protein Kpho02_03840 [Kitasatospora phosalacinea]|uniref:Uncharacterized protein n=1 Tax=Kitasatospora phosalacinea TaxID=2065 RepID=A0A9W6Q168_9ACTN|nr:hypothetical protein Kpho02_03840 [Kitasatospora phosalacinea]